MALERLLFTGSCFRWMPARRGRPSGDRQRLQREAVVQGPAAWGLDICCIADNVLSTFLFVWHSIHLDVQMKNTEKPMKKIHLLPTLVLAASLAGCAAVPSAPVAAAAPTLRGDAAHPARAVNWVDTKLYFGLGRIDQPQQGVSETAWRDFLDAEVTPRFPDGLSVVDVYGQWQGRQQRTPERLRSKLLLIDYPDTPDNRAKVEAIRSAWKQRTGDQSVLRITQPADVSF
jgi:hypothetical protein